MMALFGRWFWLILLVGAFFLWKSYGYLKSRFIDGEENVPTLMEEIKGEGRPSTGPELITRPETIDQVNLIYRVKGTIPERGVTTLFPGLVVDSGFVVGRVREDEAAGILATLAELDLEPTEPEQAQGSLVLPVPQPIDDPYTLPLEDWEREKSPVGASRAILGEEFIGDPFAEPVSPEPVLVQVDERVGHLSDEGLAKLDGLGILVENGYAIGQVKESDLQTVKALVDVSREVKYYWLEIREMAIRHESVKTRGLDWFVDVGLQAGLRPFRASGSRDGTLTLGNNVFRLTVEYAESKGWLATRRAPSLAVREGETVTVTDGNQVGVRNADVVEGALVNSVELIEVGFSIIATIERIPGEDRLRLDLERRADSLDSITDGLPLVSSASFSTSIIVELDQWQMLLSGDERTRSDNRTGGRGIFNLGLGARRKNNLVETTCIAIKITDGKPTPSASARRVE